jgi:hypothetical protein
MPLSLSKARLSVALAGIVLLLANPAFSQDCVGTQQVIDGRELNLIQVNELDGYDITGTYLYEGNARPVIELRADGSGVFEMHADRLDDGIPVPITWYVGADCDGNPVESIRNEHAIGYFFVVQYHDSSLSHLYTPGEFKVQTLTIGITVGEIFLVGERIKKL